MSRTFVCGLSSSNTVVVVVVVVVVAIEVVVSAFIVHGVYIRLLQSKVFLVQLVFLTCKHHFRKNVAIKFLPRRDRRNCTGSV